MKILLVSDAWYPQVNGVVRTYATVVPEIEADGHSVRVLSPEAYRSVACPTYGEIRLAFPASGRFAGDVERSEEHTSELQSLMRISYAVFCLKKKNKRRRNTLTEITHQNYSLI